MRYGVADSLSDYGFKFFESLHEPIFLADRSGRTLQANEAGRKFLSISRRAARDIDTFVKTAVSVIGDEIEHSVFRFSIGKKMHLVARKFANTNLILVEILR
jgi:PAS domain-containing protein